MGSEWIEDRFGSLVRFVSEKSQAKDAEINSYISTENMLPNFGGVTFSSALPLSGSVTCFKAGDTLFSNIRTYFKKVWQAKFDGCCSNDVLVFRSANTETLLQDYLHQICRWEKFTELSIRTSKGAKMPRGDKDALADFKFKIPSVEEQRAIAHILGTLDDKIELNRRMNETLEAMARALFKAWFVDFEPVRAKMAGHWQRGQSLPGLPAHLYDLFPERLVESELGEIPEGWEVGRISDFLILVYGKSLTSGNRNPGNVPVYGSGGITGFHDVSLVNGEAVIVGRKGTVGSLYWEQSPSFPIDTVFYVSPLAPLPFCYHLLESLPLRDMNTDAAVPGLNRENVYRLEIASPPQVLREEFSVFSRKLRNQIFAFQNESRSLAQLRDTLLPKLISGELRITDAQKMLAEKR